MKVRQHLWTPAAAWTGGPPVATGSRDQLVLAFGSPGTLRQQGLFDQVRAWHPDALIVGCSTAGEILGTRVHDDSLVATAVQFERSTIDWVVVPVAKDTDGREAAEQIALALVRPGLRHVMAFCDGLVVNGTSFAKALRERLPEGICATGGLAADADRFMETLVMCNGIGQSRQVVGIGFYGDDLRVGYGSVGGWDSFGPLRTVTRSRGNVLFELDGKSALALYKIYLGEHSAGLPATGLRFPLLLEDGRGGAGLVRTVLGIDEAAGSMTFGGDIPEGAKVRLMKANFDRLVDGASGAASEGLQRLGRGDAQLAVLISCVGRKLVLRQRIEEEVEGVREVLGNTALAGFYSYGELCPQGTLSGCELHNQTMTITTFSET
ncbi:MAG: FIST N-terminal domain-containing protein [Betaproteobacteria bacterium]